MRILFICSDYCKPENGSNIYTDLADSLNNNNHIVKVVVTEERKKSVLFSEPNYTGGIVVVVRG